MGLSVDCLVEFGEFWGVFECLVDGEFIDGCELVWCFDVVVEMIFVWD